MNNINRTVVTMQSNIDPSSDSNNIFHQQCINTSVQSNYQMPIFSSESLRNRNNSLSADFASSVALNDKSIDEDFPHLGSGWLSQQQFKIPQQPFSSALFQNKQYANFLRESNMLDNGFHLQSNEDFPALPAASSQIGQVSSQQNPKIVNEVEQPNEESSIRIESAVEETSSSQTTEVEKKTGIRTHPDGRVTNIPPGMLNDQYGMAGLLTFLRTIESDPSIVALALGHDLTNLGLNLNSSKRNLYQTMGGPWADFPCRIQDLDARVPEEYLTNATIRDKLPNIKLNKLQDDVLFYLFYNCPGEVYQVAAASELFQRDWRFHKTERVWITRAPFSNQPREHTGSYEKCSYLVFDPTQWRKVPREMILEYKDAETTPPSLASS